MVHCLTESMNCCQETEKSGDLMNLDQELVA